MREELVQVLVAGVRRGDEAEAELELLTVGVDPADVGRQRPLAEVAVGHVGGKTDRLLAVEHPEMTSTVTPVLLLCVFTEPDSLPVAIRHRVPRVTHETLGRRQLLASLVHAILRQVAAYVIKREDHVMSLVQLHRKLDFDLDQRHIK